MCIVTVSAVVASQGPAQVQKPRTRFYFPTMELPTHPSNPEYKNHDQDGVFKGKQNKLPKPQPIPMPWKKGMEVKVELLSKKGPAVGQ